MVITTDENPYYHHWPGVSSGGNEGNMLVSPSICYMIQWMMKTSSSAAQSESYDLAVMSYSSPLYVLPQPKTPWITGVTFGSAMVSTLSLLG